MKCFPLRASLLFKYGNHHPLRKKQSFRFHATPIRIKYFQVFLAITTRKRIQNLATHNINTIDWTNEVFSPIKPHRFYNDGAFFAQNS